jgi:hypothetical protein
LICVSLNKILDLTKDHFHEDGLRTGPTAPYSSEDRSEQDDEDEERKHRQHEQEEILRPEGHAEQDEFPFNHIEEQERMTVPFHERTGKQQRQQYNAYKHAPVMEKTMRLLRVNPFTFTL